MATFIIPPEREARFDELLQKYRDVQAAVARLDPRLAVGTRKVRATDKPEVTRRAEALRIYDALSRMALEEQSAARLRQQVCAFVVDGKSCAFPARGGVGEEFDVYFSVPASQRSGIVPKK